MAGSDDGTAEFFAGRTDRHGCTSRFRRAVARHALASAQKALASAQLELEHATDALTVALGQLVLAEEAEAGHESVDGLHPRQTSKEVGA